MQIMTRRQFIVNYSLAVGAMMGAGAIPFGLVPIKPAFAEDIKFIESNCDNRGKKILVAYESYCGSTSEVAQTIADVFCNQGANVDLRHIETIKDVSSYDGAVIGSAVKSASWYPNAIAFVKENQNDLKHIPVAYFLTCLALYYDTPETQELAKSYFNPVLNAVPQVKPKEIQSFAGMLDYSKMNMIFRMVMKSKMKKQRIPEGDFRDFNKIESWAEKSAWPIMSTV
ncbi:MAG: hypothetical protein GY699_15395 [Desulfobacteraceae bacterium]|nr:hypothetical protein [Desulfobacteraceae bacterium]